jgi:hypothetical protein
MRYADLKNEIASSLLSSQLSWTFINSIQLATSNIINYPGIASPTKEGEAILKNPPELNRQIWAPIR